MAKIREYFTNILARFLAKYGFTYAYAGTRPDKNAIEIEISMRPWLKWLTGKME